MTAMYRSSSPLKFIIRGKVPSLKNNRELIETKNGDKKLIPNAEVEKFIRYTKDSFARQLQGKEFKIIEKPTEVGFFVVLGVYYLAELPRSDVDNAVTTLQEALQEIIIEDDVQVAFSAAVRQKFISDVSVFSYIYIWQIENDPIEEFIEVQGLWRKQS